MIVNNVTEILKNRRSIREFTDDPVTAEQISTILESGRWAPSWLNIQPWQFIVIDNQKIKTRICNAVPMMGKAGINDAPVCIAVCVESYSRSAHLAEDGAAATLNMSLAAHSLGLGTYWVGLYDRQNRKNSPEAKLRKILRVPEKFRLVSILPIGVPAESPVSRRKDLSEIVCQNHFSKTNGHSAEQALQQKIETVGAVSFVPIPARKAWLGALATKIGLEG
jgi:nitroreductase